MPTYDYECTAGHVYETREPFGSPSEQDCERCGKPARRLLSAPPLIFKGSGWYATESRSGRHGDGSGSEQPAASSEDGGSEQSDGAEAPQADAPASTAKSERKSRGKSGGKSRGKSRGSGQTSKQTPAASEE